MDLAPSDYVILALAAGGALTGLFIGFSGALAFLAGSVGATFAARIGWPLSASYFESGLAVGRGVVWLAQFLGIPGAEGSVLLSEVAAHV